MLNNKSLPLKLLINAAIQSRDELLNNRSFNRLCIVGKSPNGREAKSGIYTSLSSVVADYGYEAGEYRLAKRYFEQNENGEILIVWVEDYNSIYREPPIIVEPVDPDVPPDPAGDINESLPPDNSDIEYVPYDPPPVISPPKPDISFPACTATSLDLNDLDVNEFNGTHKNLKVILSIQYDGATSTEIESTFNIANFVALNNSSADIYGRYGTRATANALLMSMLDRTPDAVAMISDKTNYALINDSPTTAFGGIDVNNIQALRDKWGMVSTLIDFRHEPSIITFKKLSSSELEGKSTFDTKAVNFIDFFNGGGGNTINGCLKYGKK